MEPDGITRVYLYSGENTVWPTYPEKTRWEFRLKGTEAEKVLARVDFVAEESDTFNRVFLGILGKRRTVNKWALFLNFRGVGKQFSVNRREVGDPERWSDLAELVQKRTRRKGLTILVH